MESLKMHNRYINRPVVFIFIIVIQIFYLFTPSDIAYAQKRTDVGGYRITTGPSVELVSIAIENFKMPTGFITTEDSVMASEMHQVLKDDLAFSLYFNVVQPDSAFLADFAKGKMDIDDWIYLGAQMLISGRIEKEGEGILFTASVTDVLRNKNAYSHDFIGQPQDYRYLMHKVARDILYNLTGEEGSYFSKISFASDASGASEIYTCDFDGYAPLQITHDKSIDILPTWSNDVKQIYYTSYKKGNPDLYVCDLADGKSRTFPSHAGINAGVAVSPDGQSIAATLSLSGDAEIYLLDISGRIIKRLTFSKMIDVAPSWAPSSKEIAYTSDRTGLPQIYITDIDGVNTRRLTFQGDYNDQACWSPRGDLIAYSSRERDGFQIYTVDITGQTINKLTDIGSNESPSWSPDGLHIVYSTNIAGENKLMVMDYNGVNKKQLEIPGDCQSPEWSKNIR
jgi:TolB protein